MQTTPPAGAQHGVQTDVGWEDQTWPGSLSRERDWWTPDAWAWRGCGSSLGQQWGGGEAGLGRYGWPRPVLPRREGVISQPAPGPPPRDGHGGVVPRHEGAQ